MNQYEASGEALLRTWLGLAALIWSRDLVSGITYNEADDTFTFTVAGRGHGVGLSQIGANGYAKIEGRDYIWILNHYFTGIVIQRVGEVM